MTVLMTFDRQDDMLEPWEAVVGSSCRSDERSKSLQSDEVADKRDCYC